MFSTIFVLILVCALGRVPSSAVGGFTRRLSVVTIAMGQVPAVQGMNPLAG